MQKFLLFLTFIVVSLVSVFGWLNISLDSMGEYAQIDESKTLMQKILVPKGMEAEYNKTIELVHNNPDSPTKISSANPASPTKTNRSSTTDQVNAFLKNEPTKQQAEQQTQKLIKQQPEKAPQIQNNDSGIGESIQVTKINKSKHYIMLQVAGYMVQNNNLIADIKLYNTKEQNVHERIEIQCNSLNEANEPTDTFLWSGTVKLPSKKVVILKSADFGYVNTQSMAKLECQIH
ncbi:hypothetical protein ACHJH3_06135 [Campylobacter sp. MOP7]|uniref:hypothetical protein n=1 Tax=Campylobacter canis TaxID=3378588 RepID=UPI00387EB0B0